MRLNEQPASLPPSVSQWFRDVRSRNAVLSGPRCPARLVERWFAFLGSELLDGLRVEQWFDSLGSELLDGLGVEQ